MEIATEKSQNKENLETNNSKTYSPIRKRTRKEPLRISNQPASSNSSLADNNKLSTGITSSNLNKSNTKNVSTKSVKNKDSSLLKKQEEEAKKPSVDETQVLTESWNLDDQNIATMSPSCVDVSKLCDFINGGDSEIDNWLTEDESPTPSPHPTQMTEVQQETLVCTQEISNCVDFEETLTHVNEILYGSHELKSTLCENGKQNESNNNPGEAENQSDSSINNNSRNVNLEEDSNDWLKEFEDDEFWGEQTRDNAIDVTFDLDVAQLFCLGEE